MFSPSLPIPIRANLSKLYEIKKNIYIYDVETPEQQPWLSNSAELECGVHDNNRWHSSRLQF